MGKIKNLNLVEVVSIAETLERVPSAKRQPLSYLAEKSFYIYGAASRAPTIIRDSSINHLHHTKTTPEGVNLCGGASVT